MSSDGAKNVRTLLERIKAGDRGARSELLELLGDDEEFSATLRAITRRILVHNHPARRIVDSQDVVQSAIRTVISRISDFRGESEDSFYGWLRAIVRSKVSHAMRPIQNATNHDPPPRSPEDPVETVMQSDLLDALRRAICRLPLDQRLVVELSLRGLTSQQAGEALGLKATAVRKREERAVRKLRTFLDD